jgi:hypothetical protein
VCFAGFFFAVMWLGMCTEMHYELLGGSRNFLDRLIKRGLIDLRRLMKP